MADSSTFAYNALTAREIRVLIPDADTGSAWCLRTVSLDDQNLLFTALSYAWASQSHSTTFSISCNGRDLQVHYNLYTALPFLARRYRDDKSLAMPYWVDAICINQADEEEKISQIRLMNDVYRRADKVLIWLGLALKPEQQELIPRAIELLPLLVKEFARSRQSAIKHDFEVDRDLSHLGRNGWEAILHLLRNSYFRRVWVVQEVALAREIVFFCGDHEIDTQLMAQAVSDSWHIRNWVIYDLTNGKRMQVQAESHDDRILFAIRDIVKYKGEEGNAHQTIRIANLLDNQTCSAPQDRVLGILGMVQEEFGDHAKDLHTYTSIVGLYTRFSTLVFEASVLTKVHWWFYLSMAFNKQRINGLPSWVPDLHNNDARSKRQPYESMISARGDPPWQASSRPRGAAHGPQPGAIIMRGKLLDEVTFVHPEVPPLPDPAPGNGTDMTWIAALVDLVRWESEVADAVLQSKARGSIRAASDENENHPTQEDTYWQTLLAGFCVDPTSGIKFTRETWLLFQQAGQHILKLVPRLEELKSTSGTDPWSLSSWAGSDEEKAIVNCFRNATHPVARFMAVLRFTRDHQLINTADGRFGFTCTGVQKGDVVCVFNDSVSPFVLRRADDQDGEARYMFVGDAYVAGLMYGEADGMDVEEKNIVLV